MDGNVRESGLHKMRVFNIKILEYFKGYGAVVLRRGYSGEDALKSLYNIGHYKLILFSD
jgi:hypothetical protein